MPREFQQDGDAAFGGFATYPNNAALDKEKGMLSYAENIRIDEGVIEPRNGCTKVSNSNPAGNLEYVAASSGVNGDYIYLWSHNGVLQRYCTTNPSGLSTVTPVARPFRQVRGQGYQDLATVEASQTANWTGDYDFTAACNVLGRMAYAKNDQVWFSLFGGVQPFNGDTVSLVQGTFDPVQALHFSYANRTLYAFGKRSVYMIKPGFTSMSLDIGASPSESFFHKVELLTSQEGILAKDSIAEVAGNIYYLSHDGIYTISLQNGMLEGQGPMSLPIKNVLSNLSAADLQKAVGISHFGRYYLSLPDPQNGHFHWVLVINPGNPGQFESLDYYPFQIKGLVTARNASGLIKPYAVDTSGKIYELETGTSDDGTHFESKFITRNYNFSTELDKRYDAAAVRMNTNGSAHVEIYANTINPDGKHLLDVANGNLGTAVRRALVGKKSTGLNLEVVVKNGRPSFYSCMVDYSIAGRTIFNIF
jgi:hypothetical protein